MPSTTAAATVEPEDRPEMPRSGGLELDPSAASTDPVRVTHARYRLTLPDDHAASDRGIQLDDDVVHAVATIGERWWVLSGLRVEGRAGLTDFAIVSPEATRYVVRAPDEVTRWFLGLGAPPSSVVVFRRTDQTLVATRREMSLVLFGDRSGPARPVTCRLFLALLLRGDPSAARVACARATLPTRVTLRADGWLALQLDRIGTSEEEAAPATTSVPPLGARFDAAYDLAGDPAGSFDPAESQAGRGTLEAINAFSREALVFVDDTAVGWVRAGATGSFAGLERGHRRVRARTIDGAERSQLVDVPVPSRVTFQNRSRLQR